LVTVVQCGVQPRQPADQSGAGDPFTSQREQRGAQPTGRARAPRGVDLARFTTTRGREYSDPTGQRRVEFSHRGRIRTLLRSVHSGCAVSADQGIVHVGRHHELHRGGRPDRCDRLRNARYPGQGRSAVRQLTALGVERCRSERGQRARSPIGAGRAPQSDHQFVHAAGPVNIEGRRDQLSDPATGGGPRGVRGRRLDEVQPAGLRRLQVPDDLTVPFDPQPPRRDLAAPDRAGHRDLDQPSTQRRVQDTDEPAAPVGQR
jgi:hypothetical protein